MSDREGLIMSRRAARASSNLMLPFIALRVHAETSGPFPRVSARTSCIFGLSDSQIHIGQYVRCVRNHGGGEQR